MDKLLSAANAADKTMSYLDNIAEYVKHRVNEYKPLFQPMQGFTTILDNSKLLYVDGHTANYDGACFISAEEDQHPIHILTNEDITELAEKKVMFVIAGACKDGIVLIGRGDADVGYTGFIEEEGIYLGQRIF